jgi:exodeoxyribonuclease-5
MNGEQGIILGYSEIPLDQRGDDDADLDVMMVKLRSLTNGKEIQVKFNPLSFSPNKDVRDEAMKGIGGFDFGYALTIHKSQGSEWDWVLVIEEPLKSDYAELMYTAYTRAISRVTVYRAS